MLSTDGRGMKCELNSLPGPGFPTLVLEVLLLVKQSLAVDETLTSADRS